MNIMSELVPYDRKVSSALSSTLLRLEHNIGTIKLYCTLVSPGNTDIPTF